MVATQQSPTGPPVVAAEVSPGKAPVPQEANVKVPPADPKSAARAPASGNAVAQTKGTQEERLERIRRGVRSIPASSVKGVAGSGSVGAGVGAAGSRPPVSADQIRQRLLSGLQGLGDGTGAEGSGGGRGRGVGGGSGSGHGSASGRGEGAGGTGHGAGGGHGDGGGGSGGGTGAGRGEGSGPGSGLGDPFFTAIGTALYEAWVPPSRDDVGGGNPTVGVRITLRFDGTITAFQLSRPSGNTAMNASVEALMRSLRRLPAPASFGFTERVKTIEVRFGLDAVGRG